MIESMEDLVCVFVIVGFFGLIVGWVDVDFKDMENYIFYVI